MFRKSLFSVVTTLTLALSPFVAQAACEGANILETMSADDRATLDAAVSADPFARGNHWRATKDDSVIDVFGTFHIYDPRMIDVMARTAPFFETADAVYVEATDAEMTQLQSEMTKNPALIFMAPDQATWPDRLSTEEWDLLKAELTARGVPPFLASKFQAWYLVMLLGIPPCAMSDLALGSQGLDKLIMEAAAKANVPVHALEPWDTLFRAFDKLKQDGEELDLVKASLATSAQAQDMFFTMTESYFDQDHRLIWELSRLQARKTPGMSPDEADADFAKMQEVLLDERNAAWIDKIVPAATGKRIVVAVGAAHLSGEAGLLKLLADRGFTVTPAPF